MPGSHSSHQPRERYRVIRLGGSDEKQVGEKNRARVHGAVIRVRVRDTADANGAAPSSSTRPRPAE